MTNLDSVIAKHIEVTLVCNKRRVVRCTDDCPLCAQQRLEEPILEIARDWHEMPMGEFDRKYSRIREEFGIELHEFLKIRIDRALGLEANNG